MADGGVVWTPANRDYATESQKNARRRISAAQHPLIAVKERAPAVRILNQQGEETKQAAAGDIDPLSGALSEVDPLSAMASQRKSSISRLKSESKPMPAALPPLRGQDWKSKEKEILQEYSVAGVIVLKSSLARDVDVSEQNKKVTLDRTKSRLEQLESSKTEEARAVTSQKEMTDRIEQLHEDLSAAWNNAERVQSLKLAIKCSKLLGDTSCAPFYPSMFVLVTNILDTFGELVFTRIRRRAVEVTATDGGPGRPLPDSFTTADIDIQAKETCRNWFYKTACIRELLPRLFIEMSILASYRFLSDGSEFPQLLLRISNIIRGIGDPLVAVYARCYLARAARRVLPHTGTAIGTVLLRSVNDYLFCMREYSGSSGRLAAFCEAQGITPAEYVRLHAPALEWQLQQLGSIATAAQLGEILGNYRDNFPNALVLHHILRAFPPALFTAGGSGDRIMQVVALVREADDCFVPRARLVAALGQLMMEAPPPQEQRLRVLNDTWKVATKCEDLALYLTCSRAYVPLMIKHYSSRELLILLRDLVKHVTRATEEERAACVSELREIMGLMLDSGGDDLTSILTSEWFLKLMDVFRPRDKTELCKRILSSFARGSSGGGGSGEKLSDPVVIHTLFDVARSLHDSIDSLSFDDERRQISTLICAFIHKIDFGRDLEQQLSVLVDCRAAFANLDSVKQRLVLAVAQLAMKAHSFMRGNHNKKTAAFVKACLAYCHITIPSIDDVFHRLHLFLLCGQVALMNGCLPQTDTFFKAAISLIPEVPSHTEVDARRVSTEPQLTSFILSFLAALVVVPAHPQNGPFYLVKGLMNAVQRYEWRDGDGGVSTVYISSLPLLVSYAQRALPYRVENVEGNDILYGGNAAFQEEVATYLSTMMETILVQIKEAEGSPRVQARLITRLLNVLLHNVAVTPQTANLMARLFDLAKTNAAGNDAFLRNTIAHVSALAEQRVKTETGATLGRLSAHLRS